APALERWAAWAAAEKLSSINNEMERGHGPIRIQHAGIAVRFARAHARLRPLAQGAVPAGRRRCLERPRLVRLEPRAAARPGGVGGFAVGHAARSLACTVAGHRAGGARD